MKNNSIMPHIAFVIVFTVAVLILLQQLPNNNGLTEKSWILTSSLVG